MNKYLDELVTLSKYDSQISAFEPQIENEKEKLAVYLQTADQITVSIDKINAEVEDIKSKRSKNNTHLAELKAKLEDVSKKHKEVKTEKEVKALQLEEEIAKEQISFANEEIARLDDITESKEAQLVDLKENLTSEEDSIKGLQVDVDNAIEELNKQRNDVSETRADLLEGFDNKILTFYEKIRRWAKDTAVVPVRKQACYGCYMKINDQIFVEVVKSEEIVNCPHCGRILYKEKETEAEVTAEA